MSDRMKGIPFAQLLEWIFAEKEKNSSVFGLHTPYIASEECATLFGRKLETLVGPAAGPHSQLAQNIIAAYYAGARFFELKTVQIMDGPELAACVSKPCILAAEEGYNCEWSTELYVEEAMEEYIKAWVLLHILSKEMNLGSTTGFQFNMSVGYDLEGIQSKKIDAFIEGMKEAKDTKVFQEAITILKEHVNHFSNVTINDIEHIPSTICNSVTLSTLHGCPPEEIERIASYLITEKQVHTFIKCNPTLLGYDTAREILDEMGYEDIAFGRFHFEDDLQYEDAIPMLERLMELAKKNRLEFGVKITNTFPVDVMAGELPSEEMYMSGKSLYALSVAVAAKLSRALLGTLRISYSGGADAFNIKKIVECGIWPVTVATTLLKPGGYERLHQLASLLKEEKMELFDGIDVEALNRLEQEAKKDGHYKNRIKEVKTRKSKEQVPLFDCHIAPCEMTCPIHQNIVQYMELVGKEEYEGALRVILEDNALPFMTGSICAHPCMDSCTRQFYEEAVDIRSGKLAAAICGISSVLPTIKKQGDCNSLVGIIGGGPAGMAAAYYLAKGGAKVTIYEKRAALGGIVNYVIPNFRIDATMIEQDIALLKQLGVEVCLNQEMTVEAVKQAGYDHVIVAVGASKKGELNIEGCEVISAISYLEEFNKTEGKAAIGTRVAVIGGGNTAMDTARAAIRNEGAKEVFLIYRRTKRYMPAEEEELALALKDGVVCLELLSPVTYRNGILYCNKMELSKRDASGRRGVTETGEVVEVSVDTVIAAIGEQCPVEYYISNGLTVDQKGRPITSSNYVSNLENVYVIGDGLTGPSIIVKAMAQAKQVAKSILHNETNNKQENANKQQSMQQLYEKKGILVEHNNIAVKESNRCLQCKRCCENCVDVCPNRANIAILIENTTQILHVDSMCNECGNCTSFCPYASSPYEGKFTLFDTIEDMEDSNNAGVVLHRIHPIKATIRLSKEQLFWEEGQENSLVPIKVISLLKEIIREYSYLLPETVKRGRCCEQ